MILKTKELNDRNITKGEQFQRSRLLEKDCFDNFPTCVWIIGLGGIGGHVAEMLGSIESIEKIVLFDDDIVELSNLGRTCYRYEHLDIPKVSAASEIITGRNTSIEVIPINQRFDEDMSITIIEDEVLRDKLIKTYHKTLIIDCRDNFYNDYKFFKNIFNRSHDSFKLIRAAYDGMSVTLDPNPENNPVWSNTGGGYVQAPSHSIPSRLAALLIITLYGIISWENDSNVAEYSDKFPGPYTFDLWKLMEFIRDGVNSLNESENI